MRARGLGLWDVYASCRREGSLDSAIETRSSTTWPACGAARRPCSGVAHNGGESARAMRRHARAGRAGACGCPRPARPTRSWSFERKLAAWRARLRTTRPAADQPTPHETTRSDTRACRPRRSPKPTACATCTWARPGCRARCASASRWRIELEYVQRMMVWMLLRPAPSWPSGHAVQLGLGAGAITRFCHSTAAHAAPPRSSSTRRVIGACRMCFQLPRDSPRLAGARAWTRPTTSPTPQRADIGAGAVRRPVRPRRRQPGARQRGVLPPTAAACSATAA